MYIYQNGKLYKQRGDSLVGVEIYFDKVLELDGTETSFEDNFQYCTPYEARCRFQITEENPYIFPVEQKEVDDEPVIDIQKPSRGRPKRK